MQLRDLLRSVGNFTPAKEQLTRVPIGGWPESFKEKFLGNQMLANILDGLNSFGAALLESTGENNDVAQLTITNVIESYQKNTLRLSMDVMYCAVQKVE
jgi:hypothetical protein